MNRYKDIFMAQDSSYIMLTTEYGLIRVFDPQTFQLLFDIPHSSKIFKVKAEKQYIYFLDEDRVLNVWDIQFKLLRHSYSNIKTHFSFNVQYFLYQFV